METNTDAPGNDLDVNQTGSENDAHEPLSPEQLYPLVAILSVFSVTGTVGNAIAFYVFSNLKKQKLTSTIFILALAGTDFITCLITIPFTITTELLDFYLKVDFFCKFYHFLITTTVPFSALVIAVIAVDRFLCICHPFLHWMTERRAKIIIACLAVFIFCIGGIICAHYSIWSTKRTFIAKNIHNGTHGLGVGLGVTDISANFSVEVGGAENRTMVEVWAEVKGQCNVNSDLINDTFFQTFRRIYSGFFLLSCIVVLVLYTLIYHSVVTQRRRTLRIRSTTCCFIWDSPGVANGEPSEVTAALELSHINGEETKIRPDDVTTAGGGGGEESVAPSHGVSNNRAPVSRTRIDRMRMANMKTALMLFVVTLVFIFSFLPAWLIALGIIKAPVIVFYMYFFYNVVNPFIYAFMNQNFRTELKKMFRCKP
ncbi:hypothetical protein BaRGS_00032801 [Batillaria attramentaria]|uniref:G-protein coupled receptors family 1 profile domain-containing protein n=1 Tax=Batillaria attramentaria TaxID=370345 RepID=A0ABD0JLP0_9CAEN|nr:hypothetical protein BaRGS_008115 [Batillaria attramentaria]